MVDGVRAADRLRTAQPPLPPASQGEVDEEDRLFADVLSHQQVRSVYQPVRSLVSGAVVAYEALSRGPHDSVLETPDRLFAAARRANALAELDRVCQIAAASSACDAGLEAPFSLFINVEPGASPPDLPAVRAALCRVIGADLPVVVELTERALTARPAELLRTVAELREFGWGIAIDDVGADPASLALLPLLHPDVIKLDLRLVQEQPSPQVARIVSAVNAEAERSGAVVLAEGIETPKHVDLARGLGATLGQGWMLGRPLPLPAQLPAAPEEPVRIAAHAALATGASPFELVAASRPVRRATKPLLIEVSKHLEQQAQLSSELAVVLATFQDVEYFTAATQRRYGALASRAAFVGALGTGMPISPVAGVRGGVLDADDVVRGEWDIAVIGPHYAAALVARDVGDTGPDEQRRFDYVLTHDRELAVQVASGLMGRMGPARSVIPSQRR